MIPRSSFRFSGLVAGVAMALTPTAASAEGSAQIGANQRLQNDTVMKIDIVDHTTETITWTGNGNLDLFKPGNNGNTPDATLGTVCIFPPLIGCTTTLTYNPDVAGTFRARNLSNQTGVWDITVNGAAVGSGRLHSTDWHFNTGSFAESAESNASFFAMVPGGAAGKSGVVELKLDGLSGFDYSIGANRTGVGGVNAGRSVPSSGNTFAPSFEMYLQAPEIATYDPVTPTVSTYSFVAGAKDCNLIVPGTTSGTFKFATNVDGTFNLVCDLDRDDIFNRVSPDDLLIVGLATNGMNSVPWDGKNNAGTNVAEGDYECKVFVNVGELHFVGRDIETSYAGLRLYGVSKNMSTLTHTPLAMFWNDTHATLIANDVNMPAPTNATGITTSGANGINSGAYMTAASANVNAHSWGNFNSSSKGNDAFIDTFGSLLSVASTVASLRSTTMAADSDGDTLGTYLESCTLGTNPTLVDTDGDGVNDNVEAPGGAATDTDMDGTIDALDKDSDNDGVCDGGTAVVGVGACLAGPDPARTNNAICRDVDGDGCNDCVNVRTGGGSVAMDGTDTDTDGACNTGDPDDDNDGVCDLGVAVVGVCLAGPDSAPLDNTSCRDADSDGCNDCITVHTGGGSVSMDGTDTDTDGSCNTGDPDDDNDGVCDLGVAVVGVCSAGPDPLPLDNGACRDTDTDGCNDCAIVHTGGGSAAMDGADFDMDGKCDVGDPDDDNDGVCDLAAAVVSVCLAGPDTAPTDINACRDFDADGCNDCINIHTGGGDADDDGLDTDMDGLCNTGDDDADGDGVDNDDDVDPLDANKCQDDDSDSCDDCTNVHTAGGDTDDDGTDTDGDGVCDLGEDPADLDGDGVSDDTDLDSDNDGIPDTGEGNADQDGDGIPDKRDLDSDNDGIADILEAGGVDKNGDGRVDTFKDNNDDGLDDKLASKPLPRPDTDDDGLKDGLDLDADADGISDVVEGGGAKLDADADGKVDDTFDENDNGWDDSVDASSDLTKPGKVLPLPDTDKDKKLDYQDSDSDADGVEDAIEGHDFDADGEADKAPTGDANSDGLDDTYKGQKTLPDRDEDEAPDYVDADDDGDTLSTKTENDDVAANPEIGADPDKDGIPSYLDPDSDNDGVDDGTEEMGDGDINEDGIPDYLQPTVYAKDTDGDGIPDFIERPNGQDVDTDGDGMPDYNDTDDDGDGVLTKDERPGAVSVDSDGDGKPDYHDPDDDNDGIPTKRELTAEGATMDTDSDGKLNHLDTDDENDGLLTQDEINKNATSPDADDLFIDTDKDGTPNHLDADDDGDGLPTTDETDEDGKPQDSDGDGTDDHLDTDDDGDGIPTDEEHSNGGGGIDNDIDKDGTPNYLDPDSDGDGISDEDEAGMDSDGDGIPDYQEPPTYGYAGGALCSTQHVHAGNAWGVTGILFLLSVLVIRRRALRPGA